MKYLHTMIRVSDPEATIRFFEVLGLKEVRRMDNEQGRFTPDLPRRAGRRGGAGRADPQLAAEDGSPAELWRGPQFRPPRLSRRRHLRDLPAADGRRLHDQPAAARRPHGLRPHARQHLDRAAAERRHLAPAEPWASCRIRATGERLAGPALPRAVLGAGCRSCRRRWRARAGSRWRSRRSGAARSARCPARC